jgi:hypothetical protein
VLAADASWVRAPFLVDTGADRTVLSAAILRLLALSPETGSERIGGLGGLVSSVSISTSIRLTRDEGRQVLFRGQFTAVTDLEALDVCVLGRDITGLFAVIVDQPSNLVSLVRERHRYRIEGNEGT